MKSEISDPNSIENTEVLVSRSSRRVSRPLIAALAAVIVLGLFFTIHKLRSARAVDTTNQTAVSPTSDDKPVQAILQPSPDDKKPAVAGGSTPTTAPAQPIASAVASVDDSALITQTPTSPVSSSTTPPATQPATQLVVMPTVSPTAQARAELPDLTHQPASNDTATSAPISTPPVSTPTPMLSEQPLQDAKAKIDAGDLLASRQLLNDALVSGRLSESDADAAKKQIDDINHTLIFSARKFANDPWGGNYTVASGERMASIAARNGCSWEFLSRVNGVTPKKMPFGPDDQDLQRPVLRDRL